VAGDVASHLAAARRVTDVNGSLQPERGDDPATSAAYVSMSLPVKVCVERP
jgi:hypothetical protein